MAAAWYLRLGILEKCARYKWTHAGYQKIQKFKMTDMQRDIYETSIVQEEAG